MNTFEVLFLRRTIRTFLQKKLEWETIADILEYADRLPMLMEGIAVEFKLVSNIEKNQGFRGPFAVTAPYYICISSEVKEDYLLNAGYLMQQLNLYIESKGLGACFVGYSSPGRELKATMKYEYVIALAFGKTDKPLYRESSSAKRLPEKELVVYKEAVTPDIQQMLNAARLAPSFYNLQPWRFVVYKNRIHVFAKKNVLMARALDNNKMIDMGIMMSNLLLAAEELWVDVSLVKSEVIKGKLLHNNEYVLTVLIG
ncbi:MAG TPA: nitroreductase family protein [Mobilitalea sp.]|nr:nitroreductase family protein [Mobilitalea sp.]